MNLFVFQRTAVTEQGNVIPNAEITVYAAGTTTQVDLFDDAAGTAKGNPFNAGPTDGEADGFIQFYVAFGQYDIAVNGTVLWENQTIGRPELDDITSLSSLNTAALVDGQGFRVVSTARAGDFAWRSADQSANVTADPREGVWVAPDSDPTGSSGAFERIFEGGINVMWFGADSTGAGDSAAAIQRASDYANYLGGGVVYIPAGEYLFLSIVVLRSNVRIEGAGRECTTCRLPDDMSTFVGTDLTVSQIGVTLEYKCFFRNFSWEAVDSDTVFDTNIHISGVFLDAEPAKLPGFGQNHLIAFRCVRNFSITDCRSNYGDNFCQLRNVQNFKVLRNRVSNHINAGIGGFGFMRDAEVAGNQVDYDDTSITNGDGYGILFTGGLGTPDQEYTLNPIAEDVNIHHNTISNARTAGISVNTLDDGGAVESVSINFNIIDSPGTDDAEPGWGIHYWGTGGNGNVIGNTIRNVRGFGGIFVGREGGNDGISDNVTVVGNTVNGVTTGLSNVAYIRIDGPGSGYVVTGNTLSGGNTVAYGIYLDVTSATVGTNHIEGSTERYFVSGDVSFTEHVSVSWAPELVFSGLSDGMVIDEQEGRYSIVGDLVSFQGYIKLSSKGTSTGAAKIRALPVSGLTFGNTGYQQAQVEHYLNMTVTEPMSGLVNGTNIDLKIQTDNSASVLTNAEFADSSQIWFSGNYYWR